MVHCKLVMTKIRTSSLSIEASELVVEERSSNKSRCGGMAKPKQIEPKYNDTDVWAYGTTSKHVVEEHGKHVVEEHGTNMANMSSRNIAHISSNHVC